MHPVTEMLYTVFRTSCFPQSLRPRVLLEKASRAMRGAALPSAKVAAEQFQVKSIFMSAALKHFARVAVACRVMVEVALSDTLGGQATVMVGMGMGERVTMKVYGTLREPRKDSTMR